MSEVNWAKSAFVSRAPSSMPPTKAKSTRMLSPGSSCAQGPTESTMMGEQLWVPGTQLEKSDSTTPSLISA